MILPGCSLPVLCGGTGDRFSCRTGALKQLATFELYCYFHFNWHEAILLSFQFSDKYIALLHSCDSQAARCVQAQSIHPLSASVRDMFSQKHMMIKWFSNVFQKDPSDPSGWHFRFTFLWTAIRVPWRQDHHAMDRPTSGFEANSSQ